MKQRRAEYFDGKKCVECNAKNNLTLDHIDRNTKISHKIWSWMQEKRDAELKKCQILCVKCHKEKTKKELATPLIHGTRMGWIKGCRCSDCNLGLREYFKDYRLRKRSFLTI